MSWSTSVSNSTGPLDEAVDAAREALVAQLANLDEAARKPAEQLIDSQLELVQTAGDTVATQDHIVSASVSGHINADGTGSASVSLSLMARAASDG